MESRLGMPSRTLLLSGGRMVGRRNRSIREQTSHWRMHHNWAKAWEPSWFEPLVELLFNDPEVTKIQTDPSPSNCERSDATRKRGFERQGTVTTPDGPAVYMVQTRQHSSEHAVLPNPSIEGGRPSGRPRVKTLNIMRKRRSPKYRLNYQR